MAETADILTDDSKIVTLPDLLAGCPMADMAPMNKVEHKWEELVKIDPNILPITYVNSSAALKAFCAMHGGTTCTSSNAENIFNWALKQKRTILFFPDQHLGGNIARKIGIPDDKIIKLTKEITEKEIKNAKVLLWPGYCPVHNKFNKKSVEFIKKKHPDIKILAHPECPQEVFDLADETGSTEKIIHTINNAPSGSKWAIGTEIHLVSRLTKLHPDKHIEILFSLNWKKSFVLLHLNQNL